MSGDEHRYIVLHVQHDHHDDLHGDDNDRQHLEYSDNKHKPMDPGEPLGCKGLSSSLTFFIIKAAFISDIFTKIINNDNTDSRMGMGCFDV